MRECTGQRLKPHDELLQARFQPWVFFFETKNEGSKTMKTDLSYGKWHAVWIVVSRTQSGMIEMKRFDVELDAVNYWQECRADGRLMQGDNGPVMTLV